MSAYKLKVFVITHFCFSFKSIFNYEYSIRIHILLLQNILPNVFYTHQTYTYAQFNNFLSTYNFHHTFLLNFKLVQKTFCLEIHCVNPERRAIEQFRILFIHNFLILNDFCYLFKISDVN